MAENLTEVDQVPAKHIEGGLNIADASYRVSEIAKSIKLTRRVKIEQLEELDELYYRADKEFSKNLLSDHLARAKIGAVIKKSLSTLAKSSPEFKLLLQICANYSNASSDIRKQFGLVGILPVLAGHLKHHITAHDLSQENIIACLTTMYNCVKESENKKYLKNENVSETLLHYTGDKNKAIKMLTFLALSYVTDDKNKLIEVDDSVVGSIIKQLEEALKTKNHKVGGWSALEITGGLKNLSANHANSLIIVKKGALPILVEMIKNGNNAEQELAGETIWMLSFHEENKRIIANDELLMKCLKDVSEAPGPAQETALGTLWMLGSANRVEEKKKATYDATKPHIMISYQWDNQELMDGVYEELRNRGYNVWMDIHRMSGSILEAMAEAVENAAIILVCMSQKYEDSPNCRTEAEYAFNLHKTIIPIKAEQDYKADGWLGALVGTKLYINFSSLESHQGQTFDKKIEKLALEIERTEITSVKITTNGTSKKPPNSVESESESQSSGSTSDTETADVVNLWVKKHSITSPQMQRMTSKELIFLQHMKSNAPQTFYAFLSGMLTVEKLREMIEMSDFIDDFNPEK